jgi:hypothetical protein
MRYCTDKSVPEIVDSRPGHDITYVTRDATYGNHLWLWFSPACPEEGGKPLLGGQRREERLFSRTKVCVDPIGFEEIVQAMAAR